MPRVTPSRRAFLGATALAGVGAATVGLLSADTSMRWSISPTFPLAQKKLWITRGALAPNSVVSMSLILDGPGIDGLVVAEEQLRLRDSLTAWPVQLSYNHPELVPGVYRYVARLQPAGSFASNAVGSNAVGSNAVESSEAVTYRIRPFVFGA
jgi:hypothetical protein